MSTPAPDACPPAYRLPDPRRPRVTLRFTVGADHRTVTGRESVVFTPDAPITELVYRLWPNGKDHRLGGSLTVTHATVAGHAVAPQLASAGGRPGTQGTLLSLPLGRTAAAGSSIVSDLDFTLRLPPSFIDRLGSDGHTAWWGTGQPLLAWVRGIGWVRTPAASTLAENAVSEAAQTDVTVTAPVRDTVFSAGMPTAPVAVSATQRRWRFTSPAARDVVVAAGRFTGFVTRVTAAKLSTGSGDPTGSVQVNVGVPPGADVSGPQLLDQIRRVMRRVTQHFGPYPFPDLTIAVVPGLGSAGIEYPGMILLGDGGDLSVTTHELIHQWFYGLVGNDQERHPWLDEAFATAGEQIVDAEVFGGTATVAPGGAGLLADRRPVDSPTSAFEKDQSGYDAIVYFKGAVALVTARQEVGPARFDTALRCYVRANAWTVATPQDVAAAFSGLPAAITVLRKAGAIG